MPTLTCPSGILSQGEGASTGPPGADCPAGRFVWQFSAFCSIGRRQAAGTIIRPSWPRFLARAGYEVKHFFAQYPGWGIGRITDELISPSEAIAFDDASWNVAADPGAVSPGC